MMRKRTKIITVFWHRYNQVFQVIKKLVDEGMDFQ